MHVVSKKAQKDGSNVSELAWVRHLLIAAALGFLALFLVLPLAAVFTQALAKGWEAHLAALYEPDTLSAIWLTLLTATLCVPINLFFGVVAAWAIAKFSFPGKSLLITLIDLLFRSRRSFRDSFMYSSSVCRGGSAPGCNSTTSKSSSPCQGLFSLPSS